jgi:hypothetical protein
MDVPSLWEVHIFVQMCIASYNYRKLYIFFGKYKTAIRVSSSLLFTIHEREGSSPAIGGWCPYNNITGLPGVSGEHSALPAVPFLLLRHGGRC